MNDFSKKVLYIDDEPNMLTGVARQLRGRVDLTTADGARAGLTAVREQGPFAVIICDYRMPEMNGVELLAEVARTAPDTVRVMLTGCGDLEVAIAAVNQGGIWRFLSKPCDQSALENAVHDALEHYRLVMTERELSAALNHANEELRQLNEDLEGRIHERTAAISRLHRFVVGLSGIDSLQNMAELIVQTTAEMLRSRRVSLMLPDSREPLLTIAAARGLAPPVRQKLRVPIGAPIAGLAYSEGRCIVVNDAGHCFARSPKHDAEFFTTLPLISTALMASERQVAVLNITDRIDAGPYGQEDLTTLETIAEASAIALQNQTRLQERDEARDAVILALARLAEHRDQDTGAHLERVQIYCRMLSEGLAGNPRHRSYIDGDFIASIVRSSPLHDIGKVGIPDHILLKPGRLTPDEFEVMKTHTTIGGDTLRGVVQHRQGQNFLQMGMEIAYHHHERYDGLGYPRGLKGEEIPLAARIVTVADVYDAMVSRRVYKEPLSHEEAVAFIRDGAGSRFDPHVAEVFLRRQREFWSISNGPGHDAPCLGELVASPAGSRC